MRGLSKCARVVKGASRRQRRRMPVGKSNRAVRLAKGTAGLTQQLPHPHPAVSTLKKKGDSDQTAIYILLLYKSHLESSALSSKSTGRGIEMKAGAGGGMGGGELEAAPQEKATAQELEFSLERWRRQKKRTQERRGR